MVCVNISGSRSQVKSLSSFAVVSWAEGSVASLWFFYIKNDFGPGCISEYWATFTMAVVVAVTGLRDNNVPPERGHECWVQGWHWRLLGTLSPRSSSRGGCTGRCGGWTQERRLSTNRCQSKGCMGFYLHTGFVCVHELRPLAFWGEHCIR